MFASSANHILHCDGDRETHYVFRWFLEKVIGVHYAEEKIEGGPHPHESRVILPDWCFQSSASGSSFDQLWPQLRDRILTLYQPVIILGSSVRLSIETSTGDIQDVMVEVGLIQDVLGVDKDLTDISLRSCWEGIRLVNQSFF